MLIKPIGLRAPRHIFEDEESQPVPIPHISIKTEADLKYNYVVIVPKTLSILQSSFPEGSKAGTITISYPESQVAADEDEYDEDEQLYNAVMVKAEKSKYSNIEIDIIRHELFLTITIPHFTNTITYNILSDVIVKTLQPVISWIPIAPCSLNNTQTINKLSNDAKAESSPLLKMIPNLKPPHVITGISGSIASKLNVVDAKFVAFVLNSEGQPGFEKSDNDAIVDTAYALAELLELPIDLKEDYLKKVSTTVRKFNGFSNSGMYI